MMKRIIRVIICSLLVLSLFTACSADLGLNQSGEIKYTIENGEATVKEAPNLSTVTEIVIPDEFEGNPVTIVADFSVVNLENVESIVIGKNVREIGGWAFTNNQKLKGFAVSEENEHFCAVDGVLFTKDMKTLVSYPPAKVSSDEGAAEYEIPSTVETIRTKAFYKCSNLAKITFPDSVKKIEEKAFFRCGKLLELKLPSKLEFIGKDAFAYCSSVKETVIPSTVTQIDDYAFYNCISMTKVTVENEESAIIYGKKWYPTNNGQDMDTEIIWAKYSG